MPKTLSGLSWVSKFPTSTSVDDLSEPFRSKATKFIAALKAAGVNVTVNATKRPKERAFLMHWSFRIAREGYDPEKVPTMSGVDIDWVHRDDKGKKNLPVSRTNAEQMVDGYDIAYRPALASHHVAGKAIDMETTWSVPELKIKDGAGKEVVIKTNPKDGGNKDLHKVGASYGVMKLASDPPHWSIDGH